MQNKEKQLIVRAKRFLSLSLLLSTPCAIIQSRGIAVSTQIAVANCHGNAECRIKQDQAIKNYLEALKEAGASGNVLGEVAEQMKTAVQTDKPITVATQVAVTNCSATEPEKKVTCLIEQAQDYMSKEIQKQQEAELKENQLEEEE